MGIRVAVHHRTAYRYDRLVTLGPQIVRLRPAPHCRTPILSYSLQVRPDEHFINWQQDPQGNYLARLVFPEPTRTLELEVDLVAELDVLNPFDFFLEPDAERYPFEYEPQLKAQLAPYLQVKEQGPRFEKYLADLDQTSRHVVDFLVQFNQRVNRDLEYVLRFEQDLQTPEETLELGRGACRDFAWLQVHLLRRLGLAARFVSGYSVQLAPDQKPLDGPAGVERDIVDLHAWSEVFLPGAGWVGLDGTSGLLAGEGHLPFACSAEAQDAAPISGALSECEVEFDITMKVTRLAEAPRHTRPYPEETWEAITACGDAVDKKLDELDVRLTQGGEPTFVSIDDYVGDEWNTEALGETKLRLATDLAHRLRRRFAPAGSFHEEQGKWYPGESLPRWSLACYWRRDGEPIWRDARWIARPDPSEAAGPDEARAFARRLAERLGADPEHVLPAHEDAAYFAWREQRLPVNVDPADPKLDDPEERERLVRVFGRGLSEPVGFVLPLEPADTEQGLVWRSELWQLRARPLLLHPGDSPLGLRLPLDSLPWAAAGDPPFAPALDPMAPHPNLPARAELGQLRVPARPAAAQARSVERPVGSGASRVGVIRTALSVEPRGGRLCVFLPPVRLLEEYLDLVAAIEDTAAQLETPVVLEGYPPPQDQRLASFKVTPDPGVIEVNVQPSETWAQLSDVTHGVYEAARLARLGTDKFLVDGRVVGTGGGNHIVLGAREPADSPFLRRPHLLRSIIAFWNNHPALSYLTSSLFIGPTSQAPRVDEGRQDALYELEVAFRQIPEEGHIPAWVVDRIFRNLLVDVTGNTHRAEICIDKLYSPDSTTGRLGLVEFRGFEMPPHARMSLAQQLLLRAVIARFWEQPYRAPLQRWGTALHDRFLLPHYCWRDFAAVLEEVSDGDVRLETAWFRPHFEFRFPLVGRIEYENIVLELRVALEPWHVLGEEPGGGGTVRFVDSSVERLQVRVTGLEAGRHSVACNGIVVPLHSTGTPGEYVAGLRFRAWQPPRCLHPTIGVHAPLVFDLVDEWSERAVAGCTYYVGHPGGRNYDTPPVNHLEAETRRRARFFPFGHTPGPIAPRRVEPGQEQVVTLDLRRC